MIGWTLAVRLLAACSNDADPTLPEDSGGYGGIDIDVYERLYVERFCAEWEVCSAGGPCPYTPGSVQVPDSCAYDPDAAQACIVDAWSCATGSSYPVEPDSCNQVCDGYGYGYGYYP